MSQLKVLPTHIALIMDGNGRWAKSHGFPRDYGHRKGAEALEELSIYANEIGIRYMTVYAFSTENWSRPEKEIKGLMGLLRRYLKAHIKKSSQNNLRINIIGDMTKLPDDIQQLAKELIGLTQNKNGMVLNIALNYGGRDEIVRGIRKLFNDTKSKDISPDDINESLFETYLDTNGMPDPDLVIRTSGEQRLSNFLIWQLAYSELYFSDCPWPDFGKDEFNKAIEVYTTRNRRFGNVE